MSSATINLLTGINGSGKTLWLLQHVEKQRKAENRPVYYWGIRGIKEAGVLDWIEIEAMDETGIALSLSNPGALHEIEQGAIIVIDEAHAVFPKGKDTPDFIDKFATSRWRGHTFYLCSQHGSGVHKFIRDRVGKHFHMVRAFGLEKSKRFEWERYADVSSKGERAGAITEDFPFPKEVYGWYKSADLHVVKKTIPWKKLSIFLWGPVIIGCLAWFVWHQLHKTGAEEQQQAEEVQGAPQPVSQPETVPDPKRQGPMWIARLDERASGQPASPQFYDSAFKAVTFPKISGCSDITINGRRTCKCNTQQGTIITTMTFRQCLFYVQNGWFDPSKPDEKEKQRDDRETQTASASPTPDQPSTPFGTSTDVKSAP